MADKKYNIGKIADAVGMSKQTVRNYEKYGIIEGDRNENNQYREYDEKDAIVLLMAKYYKSLGFSVDEIQNLLYAADENGIFSVMSEKKTELMKKMKEIQALYESLENYEHFAKTAVENVGKLIFGEKERSFYLILTDSDGFDTENKQLMNSNNYMPYTRPAIEIKIGSDETQHVIRHGAFIAERYITGKMIRELNPEHIYGKGLWVSYYFRAQYDKAGFVSGIQEFISKLRDEGYEIISDCYASARLQMRGENEKVYYGVTALVKKL